MPTETVLESNDIETVAPARVGDTLGYARVSKADGSQSLDLQREALRAEGIDDPANLYHDFASGGRDDRPGLDSCVERPEEGRRARGLETRPSRPATLTWRGSQQIAPTAWKRQQRRPHPSSASDSTNRTRSACRERECFW